MNLQARPGISEEYIITTILDAFEECKFWEGSEIIPTKLPLLTDMTQWGQLTDAELLELKQQIACDSMLVYNPFGEMFGTVSMVSPEQYKGGLRLFGRRLAFIIRLKREEELDPAEYAKRYADGFRLVNDEEFFLAFDKYKHDSAFMVYRRLTDPILYYTILMESVFFEPIMKYVSYQRHLHRDSVSSAEDIEKDTEVQQYFLSTNHYLQEIAKGEFNIRTYLLMCLVEQAYWTSRAIVVNNDVIARAIMLSSYLYSTRYTKKNKLFNREPADINWEPYQDAITGLNWRGLPGVYEKLHRNDLGDILDCILVEGTKVHTRPMNDMIARYLYSPGSLTSRVIIERRAPPTDIRSRLYEKVWIRVHKMTIPALFDLYTKYGAPFGLTINRADIDVDRNFLLHECSNLLNLLSGVELDEILRQDDIK